MATGIDVHCNSEIKYIFKLQPSLFSMFDVFWHSAKLFHIKKIVFIYLQNLRKFCEIISCFSFSSWIMDLRKCLLKKSRIIRLQLKVTVVHLYKTLAKELPFHSDRQIYREISNKNGVGFNSADKIVKEYIKTGQITPTIRKRKLWAKKPDAYDRSNCHSRDCTPILQEERTTDRQKIVLGCKCRWNTTKLR